MDAAPTVKPPDAHRLIAACFQSFAQALALIAREPALLDARTGLGETPLHYLAVENQLQAVQFLARHGAALDTLNRCGGSPLSEAASLGHAELVAWLIARGARLDLPGQVEPTLHEAVNGGSAAVVALVLAGGAEVDAVNDIREAALHLAAESDERLEILALLLDAGADLELRRIFDETPLDVARRSGAERAAALLATRGAHGSAPGDARRG